MAVRREAWGLGTLWWTSAIQEGGQLTGQEQTPHLLWSSAEEARPGLGKQE